MSRPEGNANHAQTIIDVADDMFMEDIPPWAYPKQPRKGSDESLGFVLRYLLSRFFNISPFHGAGTTFEEFCVADLKTVYKAVPGRGLTVKFAMHIARLARIPIEKIIEPRQKIDKLHEAVMEFGKYVRTRRQVRGQRLDAQSEVQTFLNWLPTFLAFKNSDPLKIDLRNIRLEHLRGYWAYLRRLVQRGTIEQSTAYNWTSDILLFFNWAAERYRMRNIVGTLHCLPQPRPCPTDDYWLPNKVEAERFFEAICRYSEFPERDVALFGLMYQNGLRTGEVRSLNWDDIDLPGRTISFREKGGTQGVIAITSTTKDVLTVWRSATLNQGPYVFAGPKAPLSKGRVGVYMTTYGLLAGWPVDRFSPYTWRHTFVTECLKQTKDYNATRLMARHDTFWITTRYTHLKNEQLVQAANKIDGLFESGQP